MLSLFPGSTFRKLLIAYVAGRDSPRLDLSGCTFSVVRLPPAAPYVLSVVPVDLPQGEFAIFSPPEETIKVLEAQDNAFQIRISHPGGDKTFLPPIAIASQPPYAEEELP